MSHPITQKFLLVGSQFVQGAQAVLAKGLSQSARVALVAEPSNPYDPLAVKVWVDRAQVADSADLDDALGLFGLSLGAIEWPLALGHLGASRETKVAKAAAKAGLTFDVVAKWHQLAEGDRASGSLRFEGSGHVTIEVTAALASHEPLGG